MIAYKFLEDGAVGPFSGFRWPAPGEWVEATPPLELCRGGIHACTEEALSEWFSDELWTVELDGEIASHEGIVIAERARLLDRIEGWNAESARDTATTGAPTSAKAVAIPWPRPRLAPTTIVVLLDRLLIVSSNSWCRPGCLCPPGAAASRVSWVGRRVGTTSGCETR
jgi:hypothetical protein